MRSRLVLGCGSIGYEVVEAVADRPGRLLVVSDDERWVETLRDESVAAELADPTDPAVLRQLAGAVDTVVVADDDPAANVDAAAAAREAYPEALVVAYAGQKPQADQRRAIADVADRVVDPGGAVAAYLLERVGDEGRRLRDLLQVLREVEGTLAVVTHDNPDPDAIASAVALSDVAAAAGCEAEPCYYGEITHQENRAFVNLLEFDLRNLEPGDDLSAYGGFALVDHSRPGVNDRLPADTAVDIVIDHHPPRGPVDGRFVDLRSGVGATSTLVVDYLRQLGSAPSEAIATGLLFGIRVDTDDFTREVSIEDFAAAAYLLPYADTAMLERVETPSMTAETLDTIARAIRNRRVEGSVLTTCVGRTGDRDALAQAADRLLDMEDIDTTLVYGIMDGAIYVSGRTRGTDLDLGETLRDAFGQIGSAGGHADMAGAQVPMGLLGTAESDDADLTEIVADVVEDRFFEALRSRPRRTFAGPSAYALTAGPGRVTEEVVGDGDEDEDEGEDEEMGEAGDEDGAGDGGEHEGEGGNADDGRDDGSDR